MACRASEDESNWNDHHTPAAGLADTATRAVPVRATRLLAPLFSRSDFVALRTLKPRRKTHGDERVTGMVWLRQNGGQAEPVDIKLLL
jgi:hypothetical protein